jgi:hypothetical protein
MQVLYPTHVGSTYACINQTGNLPTTKFIIQDFTSQQFIESDINLDSFVTLNGVIMF